MDDPKTCCICRDTSPPAECAAVRSNVRAFAHERFSLWRCAACGSIHAADAVDLDAYYRQYPFFDTTLDWTLAAGYHGLVRRLRNNGLEQGARILDYGCGGGLLVEYLGNKGYAAAGYDPYSRDFADAGVLSARYDCVIAQDVLEHGVDPHALMDRLDALVAPGGMIAVGTPNAAGIDLADTERHVHPLHQPYHRHIFSLPALKRAAADRSWETRRVYMSPYTNMPLLSLPFMHHYMQSNDGTLEVLFERSCSRWFWLDPATWFIFFFGYFLCDDADILAVFRKRPET